MVSAVNIVTSSEMLNDEELKLFYLQELQASLAHAYKERNFGKAGYARGTSEITQLLPSDKGAPTVSADTTVVVTANSNDVLDNGRAPNQISFDIGLYSRKPRDGQGTHMAPAELERQQQIAKATLLEVMKEAGLQEGVGDKAPVEVSEIGIDVRDGTFAINPGYRSRDAHKDMQKIGVQFSTADYMAVKRALDRTIEKEAISPIVNGLEQKIQKGQAV